MSNNIRFQVHISSDCDSNISEEDNTDIPFETNTPPVVEVAYNQPENNSVYLPLFVLMSMTRSLDPILSNPENISSIIVERILQQDVNMNRDPHRELQISTQSFNTTNMKFDECSICTECFEGEDTVSVLECSHIFHNKCITEWGHYSPTCPICKNNIPVRESAPNDFYSMVRERESAPNDFYRMLRNDSINDLD